MQENSFARVGTESAQDSAFSVTLTRGDFAESLRPLGTSPQFWAARRKSLSPGNAKLRQSKLGELCRLATVSRPDICPRLARIASRINTLKGCDVYRINDLVKIAKRRQPATVLKYVSSAQPDQENSAPRDENARRRKETIRQNARTSVGRSDAAYGDKSSLGELRLGYFIGLILPNICGPCRVIHWTSRFARTLAKSSLGGEVFALSEMLDHASMLRGFYGHFVDPFPGLAGLDGCESLSAHQKQMIAEKFSARHLVAIRQAIEVQSLGNAYWIPGKENPADGLTKLHNEIFPLLRLMESGTYNPGVSRPLKGAVFGDP